MTTILDELDSWTATPSTTNRHRRYQSSTAENRRCSSTRSPSPLPPSPSGRPPTTRRRRKKTISPTRSTSILASHLHSSNLPTNAPLPDLSAHSIEELQDEVRSWGFRSSSNRSTLISLLGTVWEALLQRSNTARLSDDDVEIDSEEDRIISLPQQLRGEDAKHDAGEAESSGSLSPSTTSTTSDTSEQEAAAIPISGQAALLTPQISSLLHESIVSDEQLYHRILLMEPIPFAEVWSLVQRVLSTSLAGGGSGTKESAPLQLLPLEDDEDGEIVVSDITSESESDVPLAISTKRKSTSKAKKQKKGKAVTAKKGKKQTKMTTGSGGDGTQGIKGRLTLEVKAWLDLRGITWYEGELTGPRSRHS